MKTNGGSSVLLFFDATEVFEVDKCNNLDQMDEKRVHIYRIQIKVFEEYYSYWACTFLFSELMFGGFTEYVITRRHINKEKYLSISYY